MKASNRFSYFALAAAFLTITLGNPFQLRAQTVPVKPSPSSEGLSTESWSVQVDKIDAGDVNLEPAFQVAIYESLLDELSKTKRFKQVLRAGDRNAGDVADLLVLWLGEAAGVPKAKVLEAQKAALAARPALQALSAAIRKVIPWELIVARLDR